MSKELRLIQIEGYERIDDWTMEQISTAQLDKKIIRFKNDYNSLNEQYIGIVFHDRTYIYGVVYCDGSCNEHDPYIDFDMYKDLIDYKAAYQMGLINEEQYETCKNMVEKSTLDYKRAQLEQLKRELGES